MPTIGTAPQQIGKYERDVEIHGARARRIEEGIQQRLCCQVEYEVRPLRFENCLHGCALGCVLAVKREAVSGCFGRSDVFHLPKKEIVDHRDACATGRQQRVHQMATDEAGAAGHDRPPSLEADHSAAGLIPSLRVKSSPIFQTSCNAANPSSPETSGFVSCRIMSMKCDNSSCSGSLRRT